MERKRKYRAWDEHRKQMVPLVEINQYGVDVLTRTAPAFIIPMEFTGIIDEKGKEVYEGDIVKRQCLDENCDLEHRGEVVYNEVWAMWSIKDYSQPREGYSFLPPLAFGMPSKNVVLGVEVLGDIYRNPELVPV